MALNPLIASRFAQSFTIESGSANISSRVAWASVTIDYGNEGSEVEPPSRGYVGSVNASAYGFVALILPISNESIFVQEPLDEDAELRCSVKWLNRLRRF